jgi:hypothetical protein
MSEPYHSIHNVVAEANRRRFHRIGTRIEARLVFAGVDTECLVHEMSATGAIVESSALPKLDTDVALDVPGVGFARGKTLRYMDRDTVCISLATTPAMQARFADKLILAAFRSPPE